MFLFDNGGFYFKLGGFDGGYIFIWIGIDYYKIIVFICYVYFFEDFVVCVLGCFCVIV